MGKNKQKKKRKHNSHNIPKTTPHFSESTARFWARFWRYYYFFLVLLILFLIGNKYVFLWGFSLSLIFHGSYWLYMAKKMPRHFILAMLDFDKKSMKNARPSYPPVQIKKWKHDARAIGLCSIICGIGFLLLSLIEIYL